MKSDDCDVPAFVLDPNVIAAMPNARKRPAKPGIDLSGWSHPQYRLLVADHTLRGRTSFSAKRQAIIKAVGPKKIPDPLAASQRCAVQLDS
jgi:hypothetical protein